MVSANADLYDTQLIDAGHAHVIEHLIIHLAFARHLDHQVLLVREQWPDGFSFSSNHPPRLGQPYLID
jgi:hypothetical protein